MVGASLSCTELSHWNDTEELIWQMVARFCIGNSHPPALWFDPSGNMEVWIQCLILVEQRGQRERALANLYSNTGFVHHRSWIKAIPPRIRNRERGCE